MSPSEEGSAAETYCSSIVGTVLLVWLGQLLADVADNLFKVKKTIA
jgi:hypothetical protein